MIRGALIVQPYQVKPLWFMSFYDNNVTTDAQLTTPTDLGLTRGNDPKPAATRGFSAPKLVIGFRHARSVWCRRQQPGGQMHLNLCRQGIKTQQGTRMHQSEAYYLKIPILVHVNERVYGLVCMLRLLYHEYCI